MTRCNYKCKFEEFLKAEKEKQDKIQNYGQYLKQLEEERKEWRRKLDEFLLSR